MITQNLKSILNESCTPVHVTFTKIDGTIRKMECTTNFDLIPVEFHPKQKESPSINNDKIIRVFDFVNRGWRSFLIDNIISFEPEV